MSTRSKRFTAIALFVGIILATFVFSRPQYHSQSTLPHGECTWYAFERANEAGWRIRFDKPYGRHARAWWEKVANAQHSFEPTAGSIMVMDAWPGNPYGHVAYVESVSEDGTWVISHANLGVGSQSRILDGTPVFKAKCERTRGGVR